MNNTQAIKPKRSVGRPTVMTQEVLGKLEEAFAIGASDEEACFYANICKQALYDYQNKKPEFTDRKEALKQKPILKARQTLVKSLEDPVNAKWLLERKRKNEFSTKTETDIELILPVPIYGGKSDTRDNV